MPAFQHHYALNVSYITAIVLSTFANSITAIATATISDPKRQNLIIVNDYYLISEKKLHLHFLQLCYHR
jgi:hypothetical protein